MAKEMGERWVGWGLLPTVGVFIGVCLKRICECLLDDALLLSSPHHHHSQLAFTTFPWVEREGPANTNTGSNRAPTNLSGVGAYISTLTRNFFTLTPQPPSLHPLQCLIQ